MATSAVEGLLSPVTSMVGGATSAVTATGNYLWGASADALGYDRIGHVTAVVSVAGATVLGVAMDCRIQYEEEPTIQCEKCRQVSHPTLEKENIRCQLVDGPVYASVPAFNDGIRELFYIHMQKEFGLDEAAVQHSNNGGDVNLGPAQGVQSTQGCESYYWEGKAKWYQSPLHSIPCSAKVHFMAREVHIR